MCNTKNKVLAPICMALSMLAIAATVSAHENAPHVAVEAPKLPAEQELAILKQINEHYLKDVKPIFRKSCFDCHSSTTNYPWYSKLPGAKQLIESDIEESRKHLDLSNDFPFGGHGGPAEDLEAIDEVVDNGSMPPFRYWVMHPGSRLTAEEKQRVKEWTRSSLQSLAPAAVTR